LSFTAHKGDVTRAEVGSWTNRNLPLADDAVLATFGRFAFAHEWQSAPQANATFLGLSPIASFSVGGAKPAADLALITAGAELRMNNGWGLMSKFDGEFGLGTQTYMGTLRARYAW